MDNLGDGHQCGCSPYGHTSPFRQHFRPVVYLSLFWLFLFFFYTVAMLPVPFFHGLAEDAGLVEWVRDDDAGWRVVLAVTFGVLVGGLLRISLKRHSPD